MNIGDHVTVVWGFPPEPFAAEVVSTTTKPGYVHVRPLTSDRGMVVGVPACMVDVATITVARATGYMHRATDPETARLAAEAQADRLTEAQWTVLTTLVLAGRAGLIDHEHEQRNGLAQDTAGSRRKQLERYGLTEPTGERRLTPRGSYADVHRATARGIAAYQMYRASGAA